MSIPTKNSPNFLPQIPPETLKIIPHYPQHKQHGRLGQWQPSLPQGKGIIDHFHLFPGLHLSHVRFLAPGVHYQHPASDMVIEINHCRRGRASWHLHGGKLLSLNAGDIDIHTTNYCANSQMDFPAGFYEGITLSLDLKVFGKNLPPILREAQLSTEQLYHDFCMPAGPLVLPSGSPLDRLLAPLYNIPDSIRLPYYQLKIQEILLLLSVWKPTAAPNRQQYHTEQAGRLQEIHAFLTENLSTRYTIAQLAQRFNINPTTLKREFKATYGLPIAHFMQEYRMQEAMKRIRETDTPLSVIAQEVGYTSQSKFTQVFKAITGKLPTAYRRQF
ncbi:MAG: AraC family transcriptional regulator [Selenomonas sp.]|uniref:helix-turn-helix domain-containing protein n=1 Tax=Selenomonas sp. TaxID=2053611 RepID=UPI0025DCEA90|nr:AraC family transcriptional regulator [Selenomonas sp.]MCR5757958.1 AraC family transcriptional regulator [Selenomonas sp.]